MSFTALLLAAATVQCALHGDHAAAAVYSGTPGSFSQLQNSDCWRLAARTIDRVQEIQQAEPLLRSVKPDKDKPCVLFDDRARHVLAIAMLECRARDVTAYTFASASNDPPPETGCLTEQLNAVSTPAELSQLLVACLPKVGTPEYTNYLGQFNHIETTCFHIHAQLWHESTTQMMTDLTTTAHKVKSNVVETARKQDVMLDKQQDQLKNQDHLIKLNHQLQTEMENGQLKVRQAFEVMEHEIYAEHAKLSGLLREVFDGLNKLASFHQYIKTKLMDFQSLVLYTFFVFVAHHLTSTIRTHSARLPVLLVLVSALVVEFLILRVYDEGNPVMRHGVRYVVRYGSGFLAACTWIHFYATWEDQSVKALTAVRQDVLMLHRRLDNMWVSSSNAAHRWEDNRSCNGGGSVVQRRKAH